MTGMATKQARCAQFSPELLQDTTRTATKLVLILQTEIIITGIMRHPLLFQTEFIIALIITITVITLLHTDTETVLAA